MTTYEKVLMYIGGGFVGLGVSMITGFVFYNWQWWVLTIPSIVGWVAFNHWYYGD